MLFLVCIISGGYIENSTLGRHVTVDFLPLKYKDDQEWQKEISYQLLFQGSCRLTQNVFILVLWITANKITLMRICPLHGGMFKASLAQPCRYQCSPHPCCWDDRKFSRHCHLLLKGRTALGMEPLPQRLEWAELGASWKFSSDLLCGWQGPNHWGRLLLSSRECISRKLESGAGAGDHV